MPSNDLPQGRGTFTPPRPIPITPVQVAAISAALGIPNVPLEPIESIGIINSVYRLGDSLILRVPRDHAGHVQQAHREAQVIPAAVDAGVSTPRLLHFDDSLQILPVPFLVVDRVRGTNAESLCVVPPEPAELWRSVGQDVARLHLSRTPPPPGEPWPDELRDPRDLVDLRADDGWISPLEADRVRAWLDWLAPLVPLPAAVFLHGDLQMSNVLADPARHDYRALIDWGGARLGNPADDFSTVPLGAVEPMLEGYREVASAELVTNEASILWRRLQLVLRLLPRGAAPGWAWAERPVARLTDMLLHFHHVTGSTWRDLGPQFERTALA